MQLKGTFRGTYLTIGLTLALVAVGLLVVGCGSGGSSTGSTGSSGKSGSGEAPKVALFQSTLNEFSKSIREGLENKVSPAGGSIQEYSAEFNAEKELTQCEDAVTSQRFNTLVIVPIDGPTMVPCAVQAGEAGIKVIAFENPIGPNRTAIPPQIPQVQGSIIIPAEEDAKIEWELVEEACGNLPKCEVAQSIAYSSETLSHIKRTYFEEQDKASKNIEIVDVVEGEYQPPNAEKNALAVISGHPNLNVFVFEDDECALAGVKAIKGQGLQNQIKVIGDAGSREGAKAVEEGVLFGTGGSFPRTMAEVAGEMSIELTEEGKEKVAKPAVNMFELGTPHKVTKKTVKEYEPQWGQG